MSHVDYILQSCGLEGSRLRSVQQVVRPMNVWQLLNALPRDCPCWGDLCLELLGWVFGLSASAVDNMQGPWWAGGRGGEGRLSQVRGGGGRLWSHRVPGRQWDLETALGCEARGSVPQSAGLHGLPCLWAASGSLSLVICDWGQSLPSLVRT